MKSKLLVFRVFLFAPQFGQALAAAPVPIYAADFEAGAGAEWSNAAVDATHVENFTKFSGRYGNSAQTLTLNGVTPGTPYTARFDLYIVDSWDGVSHNDSVIV